MDQRKSLLFFPLEIHAEAKMLKAGQSFDYIVTVCDWANETCIVIAGSTKKIHVDIPQIKYYQQEAV